MSWLEYSELVLGLFENLAKFELDPLTAPETKCSRLNHTGWKQGLIVQPQQFLQLYTDTVFLVGRGRLQKENSVNTFKYKNLAGTPFFPQKGFVGPISMGLSPLSRIKGIPLKS
jgi:hypothetical protein